jgi:hypothetical protein
MIAAEFIEPLEKQFVGYNLIDLDWERIVLCEKVGMQKKNVPAKDRDVTCDP